MTAHHPNLSPDMVAVLHDRLHALFLRAFAHLRRQPQHVADVRAAKRPAIFVKHRSDLWRMVQHGANPEVILEALDELRADVASWRDEDAQVACVLLQNISETEAQGAADVLTLVATRTDEEADLERAYDAQQTHLVRGKRLVRAIGRRLGEKRRLRTVARTRLGLKPLGAA